MEKQEHGTRLKVAMGQRGLSRKDVADATDVSARTVTNWTTGATMPSETEKAVLRRLLGHYDAAGDPVIVAIDQSDLAGFRKTKVKGFYEEQLYDQAREERGA